jgi:hypothetical protein
MHQRLKPVRKEIRHAAGAAIFDVVMDRMSVSARGLKGGEHRRGLRTARDHKALAEGKIFEPALRLHHAMPGGIEVDHGGVSCCVMSLVGPSVS